MSTNIVQIKIKLGPKEVELTADEARDVYRQLNLIFAQANENPSFIHTVLPSSHPIHWDTAPWPYPFKTEITCLSNGNSVLNITS